MRPLIGIFGPGEGATAIDIEQAGLLGELVARRGWIVLTGGRNEGVMRAATEGAKRVEGGLTIGILPSHTSEGCAEVDIAIVTGMGNARNNINVLSSHAIVAVGSGGAGTVSEIALALKADRTVILLGAPPETVSFYQRLGRGGVVSTQSPEEAVAEIGRLLKG